MSQLALDLTHCQRWRHGRERWRPAGEVFDHRLASVAVIDQADSKGFVVDHHYSRSFPAARLSVGLFVKRSPFQKEALEGVAVFAVPMTQAVVPHYFPDLTASQGVELSRFVLTDACEANAESWFLSRALKSLRSTIPEVAGVVSYCDPLPRHNIHGELVKKGHVGTIYRATNLTPRGRSKARTLLLCPDGSVASERALSKLRNGEVGEGYVERWLSSIGAPARRMSEAGADYVARLRDDGFFRATKHPGNLVFCWRARK